VFAVFFHHHAEAVADRVRLHAPRGRRRGGAELFELGVGEGLDDAGICALRSAWSATTSAYDGRASRSMPSSVRDAVTYGRSVGGDE
jgi:hypothetical protein